MTSSSATNDARRDPSRRLAAIPRAVGDPGGDDPEPEQGEPPADGALGVHGRVRGRVHRQDAHGADRGEPECPDREAGAGERHRRQVRALVRAEHEVGGGAGHRDQRPDHADGIEVRARQQIEDQDEAERGQAGTGHRQRARALAVPQPEPDHHGGGRRVLDQQRRTDVHPLHRGEVGELRARDRYRAEDQHEPEVPPQRAPAAAQRAGRDRRDDEGPERDAHQHDRAGRPAGVEQSARQRAGEPERGRRGDRQRESDGEARAGGRVISHPRHGR